MSYTSVTIEGTVMPAAGVLETGERKTVALTPYIHQLVDGGFVKIVEVHTDDDQVEVTETITSSGIEELVEPKRNASRDDWAEYLAQHRSGIVTEGKNRDELQAEYDEWLVDQVAPADAE